MSTLLLSSLECCPNRFFPTFNQPFSLLGSSSAALTASTPVYHNRPGQRCRVTLAVLPWQPLILTTSLSAEGPSRRPLPPPSVDGGAGQMVEPSWLSLR